jgi:hypothetical protein
LLIADKAVTFTLFRWKSFELFFSCLTSALGRAAVGPRRGFVPQAQAAKQLLKHSSASPRRFDQRLELFKGTSPREPKCQIKPLIFTLLLQTFRVVLLLLRQRRDSSGLGELQ